MSKFNFCMNCGAEMDAPGALVCPDGCPDAPEEPEVDCGGDRDPREYAFLEGQEPEQEEADPVEVLTSVDEDGATHDSLDDHEQGALFDLEALDWWREHWQDMPEFLQEDLTPWKTISVHFECRADMEAFAALVEQKMTERTRSLWYPEAEIGRMMNKRFADA